MSAITLEICVDSLDGALAAQEAGAHRIELCGSLSEGGITPSAGLIQIVRERIALPIHVLIRPRGGDFCCTPAEFDTMRRDIAMAREQRVHGIVIGLLNPDGTVDVPHTRILIETARPLSVTFHRAFDMARDPFEAASALADLGIDRILTSGGAPSVEAGLQTLAQLVQRSRVSIMPGGGVTEANIQNIVRTTSASEIHASARSPVECPMRYRNPRVSMTGASQPAEYTRLATDPERIRKMLRAIDA